MIGHPIKRERERKEMNRMMKTPHTERSYTISKNERTPLYTRTGALTHNHPLTAPVP
jgi:hypothetical protein